ncbi:MAG: hypothetical protein ABH832_03150 [bacterium]
MSDTGNHDAIPTTSKEHERKTFLDSLIKETNQYLRDEVFPLFKQQINKLCTVPDKLYTSIR